MKLSPPFMFSLAVLAANVPGPSTAAEPSGLAFELAAGAERDSNLNVVELDQSSQESATAAVLKAKLDARWQASPRLKLQAGYSYAGRRYQEHEDFDLAIHKLSADASYDLGWFTPGLSHHVANAQLAGRDFLDLKQTSVHVSRLFNDRYYFRLAHTVQDKSFNEHPDRDADNRGFSADAFVFFNNARSFIALGGGSEDESANAEQFDYDGVTHHLSFSHKFTLGENDSKLHMGWRHWTRDYSGLTPELDEQRNDSGQVTDLEWELGLSKNMALLSKVEFGQYHSNLPSADYDETLSSLLFKLRF